MRDKTAILGFVAIENITRSRNKLSLSEKQTDVNGNEIEFTFEGSTFWKFLTQEMTRSVTSDLSRKQPLTSSQKRRIKKLGARVKGVLRGRASTRTLKYFIRGKVLLLAAI